MAVLGVAGLLFAMATGIPIGAQFVTPALNSVAYFFDGGHGGNGMFVWYYTHNGHNLWDAFVKAAESTGITIILNYIGVPLITDLADLIAAGVGMVAEYIATLFITVLPWWLGPVVIGYAAIFAAY